MFILEADFKAVSSGRYLISEMHVFPSYPMSVFVLYYLINYCEILEVRLDGPLA